MKWNNFSQTHDFFFIEGQIEPVFNCPCLGQQVVTAPPAQAEEEIVTQRVPTPFSALAAYLLQKESNLQMLCSTDYLPPLPAQLAAVLRGVSQDYFHTLLMCAEDMKKKGGLREKPLFSILWQTQSLCRPYVDFVLQ